MLVPHAHYRVFHGDPARHAAPNDQIPLALSPRRLQSAPTDLHLREFAQLEVQVKALQLQAAQHPKPGAMGNVVAGSLAECFLFYSRLLTVESFPWPDFLAAVFTKLAEHFAASESEIVRSSILRVFQRAKAHVAQVNDPSKLLSHLAAPLTDAKSVTARTLTLQLLATMPSLLEHDSAVQQQIVARISAGDQDERLAAIEAARALLPHSPSFRKDVVALSLGSKSAALCHLLADAVSSFTEAREAWTHCAEIYERLADDKSAIASVRAMTTLTTAYPDVLLEMHGQLLHHMLDHDPRGFVRNFALLSAQQLVMKCGGDMDTQLAYIIEGIFSRMGSRDESKGRIEMRLKLSALLLLDKWSSASQELGESAGKLLETAKDWIAAVKDGRFGKAYVSIIANVARQRLALALLATSELEHLVDGLLLLLHPRANVVSEDTWSHALEAIAQLSQEFPDVLAAYLTTRLLELLSIPADGSDDIASCARKTEVLRVLGAQTRPPNINIIQAQLPVLLQELTAVEQNDAPRLRAVAATFFLWTQELPPNGNDETDNIIKTFEQELLKPEHYESHAERYQIAKLAMLRGRFSLATKLMEIIAARTDSECFGGWLHALHSLCEAEARTTAGQSVHLKSIHALSRATMYLQASRTSSFRFDFQLHLVALRLEWLQLVQNVQQVAGEAAFTYTAGNAAGREGRLSAQLRTLALKFGALRASMLGADQRDLDTLQAHAKMCGLLAAALEGFLMLRPAESIDLPVISTPSVVVCSQWCMQMCRMLSEDIRGKLDRLAKMSTARQPGVGARVLQQLLAAICAVPLAMPRLFFCSRLRAKKRLLSSAQFLTYAENAAFTAKPRSRSQLGVSLGTDFTSVLKGVVAFSRNSHEYWSEQIETIEVTILVCVATPGAMVGANSSSSIYEQADAPSDEKLTQHKVIVQLPAAWGHAIESIGTNEGAGMLYLPFETQVHVKAANLTLKGSYFLVAKLAAVDRQGDRWPLAATGCRRGFIVY